MSIIEKDFKDAVGLDNEAVKSVFYAGVCSVLKNLVTCTEREELAEMMTTYTKEIDEYAANTFGGTLQ